MCSAGMPRSAAQPAPPTVTSVILLVRSTHARCRRMARIMNRLQALALLLVMGFVQGLSLQCDPLPYEIYWNVADANPPGINVEDYNIFPANYTQTGNACSTRGCKHWNQGVFPTISASGKKVNGGVPQNASLSDHLDALARDVVQWIPDPEWLGNAVLDFEDWTTVWELNTGGGDWHSRRYPEYSIVLEAQEHPDWDLVDVYLHARKQFNISALEFFAETLKTLSKLRPKAKWGFYGLPMNFNEPFEGSGASMKCGYDSDIGDLFRELSDQQRLVWAASTALFPSIYLPPGRTADENAAYVRSVIRETVRCADGSIPVYGFHWNYYHDAKSLLSLEDLKSGLLGPYDVGAQGVVIWGSSAESKKTEFLTYVKEHVGPLARNFTEQMCQCSQTHCHGHGRCMPSSSTNCQCYPGYSGTNCEHTTPAGRL